MNERRIITLHEDGHANYQRIGTLDSGRERTIEEKDVALHSLLPARKSLVLRPPNCRIVETSGRNTIFVTEEPPCVRTVHWDTGGAGYEPMQRAILVGKFFKAWGESEWACERRLRTQTDFRLAFPWLIKCYHFVDDAFASVALWYRTDSLTSERDNLLVPNLPNRNFENHLLCLTNTAKAVSGKPFAEMIREIEKEFWGGAWNADWMQMFLSYASEVVDVSSPWQWEASSLANPFFMLQVPWHPAPFSLGSYVRKLINETKTTPSFDYFAHRVQVADHWDGVPPEAETAVQVSASRTLELSDSEYRECAELAVGDTLTFDTCVFPGTVPHVPYTVEWFSEPNHDCSRLVQLATVPQPLPLLTASIYGYNLMRGVTHHAVALRPTPTTLDGVLLEPQVFYRFFHHNKETYFPNRTGYYRAANVTRRGTVVYARFLNETMWTPIGDGETSFPGVSILEKEVVETGGKLSCTLGDGTVVSVGDRVFHEDGNHLLLDYIHRFLPLSHHADARCVELASGQECRIEGANGLLHSKIMIVRPNEVVTTKVGVHEITAGIHVRYKGHVQPVLECSPLMGLFRRVYAKFYDENWYLIASEGSFTKDVIVVPILVVTPTEMKQGTKILLCANVPYLDGATGAVEMVRRFWERGDKKTVSAELYSGKTVIVAVDGECLHRFIPVETFWSNAAFKTSDDLSSRVSVPHIVRGMRLRLRVANGTHPAGKQFLVSHVTLSGVLVFHNGEGCAISMNLSAFDVRVQNKWIPLVTRSALSKEGKPGQGLWFGETVRYLGGDEECGFFGGQDENGRTVFTPERDHLATRVFATLEDGTQNGKWLCRFDLPLPGCGPQKTLWIQADRLVRVNRLCDPCPFSRIFERRKNLRCVHYGQIIGSDRNGKQLKIGDRVQASQLLRNTTTHAHALAEKNHVFTIVHSNSHYLSERLIVWLDAGRDIGGEYENWSGLQTLPDEFQIDRDWWKRITFAESRLCMKVD